MLEFCQCSCRLICTSSIWLPEVSHVLIQDSILGVDLGGFPPKSSMFDKYGVFFSSFCFNWMFFNHKPNSSIMNHAQAVSLLKKECFGGLLFFIGIAVIAVDISHGFWAKTTRMATGDDQHHSFKVIIFEIC